MFESGLLFSGHIARLWLARRAGTVLCPSGNPCRDCRQRGLLLWDLEPMEGAWAGAWEGFWLGEVMAEWRWLLQTTFVYLSSFFLLLFLFLNPFHTCKICFLFPFPCHATLVLLGLSHPRIKIAPEIMGLTPAFFLKEQKHSQVMYHNKCCIMHQLMLHLVNCMWHNK